MMTCDAELPWYLLFTGEKLQWFHNHLDPQKVRYSKKDACELTER
jgi:translation machinery-associated protein 16